MYRLFPLLFSFTIACADKSEETAITEDISDTEAKTGASFTGNTLTIISALDEYSPSVTVTVKVKRVSLRF